MKIAFYTLGCKVNQYETNAMIQECIAQNYEIVDFNQKADVYIINTCTVTNMSDKKSRQMLRRTKHLNPNSIVVAVGCYAQVAKEKLEEIPDVDIILGTNEKNSMITYIEEYKKNKKKEEVISDVMQQKEYLDFGKVTYTDKTRAVIKIQDGCDRFCSYCIIPYARGRVRSRRVESVLAEARAIVEKGLQEIVLTGIHIASYGRDLKENITLIDLLEELDKIKGIKRIRLGSLEPTIITEEFITRLAKLQHICDHFHLSLQSGCDETLKRMNRRYTTEEFEEVVKRIRKYYQKAALTTDIIVGFPGETEEEFEKTYQFLEKINFYKMHIFPYSARNGTKAAVMPNQITKQKKEERSARLIVLSNRNEKKENETYIGKDVQVLFEEREGEYQKGHTTNYIMVKVKTGVDLQNTIKKVKIENVEDTNLVGTIVTEM